jgi:phosphoribosylanthranilate isomerase
LTLVKICGLREPAHALAAAQAGADLVGLVFAESRRRVTVEEARAIAGAVGEPLRVAAGDGAEHIEALLRRKRPLVVGVFAGADADTVNHTAEAVGLDLVQLSGDEPWEMCQKLALPVLKAVKVRDGTSAEEIITGLRPGVVPLLDTHAAEALGGTGRPFDWAVATEVARRFPIVLAGGLTPGNVGEAVRRVRPWAVDVSSGVETDGVKDVGKVRAFVEAVREASI